MNKPFDALLFTAFVLGFSVFLSSGALAADFLAQNTGQSTVNISSTAAFNITITNLDASANITQVNLNLGGFAFASGSNLTSASNSFFSNFSYSALNWTNYSGLIRTGETFSFMFSAVAPQEGGSYNITVNVTDTSNAANATNITYTVAAVYSLTFAAATTQQSSNTIQNLNYTINVTNNGVSGSEAYNFTVVNCSTNQTAGVGTLNATSYTIGYGQTKQLLLSVSNSTSGLYTLCIMANHWNGTSADTTWNFTSGQNGVSIYSGFYPDLVVSTVSWTSTGLSNPFAGGNVTVYAATLNNTGHFNFTVNMTAKLFWDGVEINGIIVENTSLGNGTSFSVSFSNVTVITNGLHNLSVLVDASNNVIESSEANNYYNTTVFVGYNVTVLNVIGYSGVNISTNRNMTVNVSVLYPNGSAVSGLTKYNFTVYDIQRGYSFTSNDGVLSASFTNSMASSGVYWFNITSYSPANDSDTLPGTHNITVSISNNESGNVYSGNSTGSPYYYLLVPKLYVALTASSSSVNEGSPRSIIINVSNNGTAATEDIYNVTLAVYDVDALLTSSSISGCSKTFGNNMLGVGEYMVCSTSMTAGTVTENTLTSFTIRAQGNYNYSGVVTTFYKNSPAFTLTIMNVASGTTTITGGSGTTLRSCTSDSSCYANESCSATKKCVAISCPDGEIMDHVCIATAGSYNINITSFQSTFESASGGNVTSKVTVKNTGSRSFTAKLEVSISSLTAIVSPASYALDAGESYQFTVNLSVPDSVKLGNFSGTLKAYVSSSTSYSDSKSFSVMVLPSNETKISIQSSYQEILASLLQIIAQLNQMKSSGQYNESAIASLEEMISSANSSADSVKEAIDSEDYIHAQSLLSQLNASLDGINQDLNATQVTGGAFGQTPGAQGSIWLWAAIAVIVVFLVGFFVYMFYPSRAGSTPQKGFSQPSGKPGIASRIKGLFKRKKPSSANTGTFVKSILDPADDKHYDTFHYSEGYKKERSYNFDYKDQSPKGLLGKLRSKKNKKEPQTHIDQFAADSKKE